MPKTELGILTSASPDYHNGLQLFNLGWKNHQRATPTVVAVYEVLHHSRLGKNHLDRYFKYRNNVQVQNPNHRLVEEPLFHGTRRACTIGDDGASITSPCTSSDCDVCHILRCDFAGGHAEKVGYWGKGIYTTTASNKADYFSKNVHNQSSCKVVLLSKVVVGNHKHMTQKDGSLTRPPPGYHSIKAITEDMGGVVKYSERVVYDEAALCPWLMIVYT